MIFFESPHRLVDALRDLAAALGPERRVVVCRELTKLHEEVKRGTASELADHFAEGARGEICIVVEGAAPATADLATGIEQVRALVAAGARLKEARRGRRADRAQSPRAVRGRAR